MMTEYNETKQNHDPLLQQGLIALQQGDLEESISLLQKSSPSFQQSNLLGIAHQMNRDWNGAKESWQRALTFNPNSEDVCLNLGIAYIACGEKENAEHCWRHLITINPAHAQCHINLGLMYREQERNLLAHNHWEKALELVGHNEKLQEWLADVKGILGIGWVALGRLDKAEPFLKDAVQMDPTYAILWGYLAEWHVQKKSLKEALACCTKSIELDAENPSFYHTLGNVYRHIGDEEAALSAYKQAISLGGHHVSTRRAIAELEQQSSTEGPTIEPIDDQLVVTQLFDQYASRFDEHLENTLQYRTPSEALTLFETVDSTPFNSILDLGCGTGLSMEPFWDFCSEEAQVIGVDLSKNMLDKAKQKRRSKKPYGYAQLIHQSLESFLDTQHTPPFDLILSLDTFVYVHDLQSVLDGISKSMHKDSLLLFSTENTEKEQVTLQRSGRYAHPHKVILQWFAVVGLDCIKNQYSLLRKDGERWVEGTLWIARLQS